MGLGGTILDVTPADPAVAVLVDRRTGYTVPREDNDPFWPASHFDNHPNGEGDGAQFDILIYPDRAAAPEFVRQTRRIIRAPGCELDGTSTDRQVHLLKVDMADMDANRQSRILGDKTAIFNKYDGTEVKTEAGTDDERDYYAEVFDSEENARLTIGPTTGTYASWSAAISAASSGDFLAEVDGATYTENVAVGAKILSLVGTVGTRSAKITASSGFVVDQYNSNGNVGGHFDNMEIEATGAATYCHLFSASGGIGTRIKAHGGSANTLFAGGQGTWIDCGAYDGVNGFRGGTNSLAIHCTAVDNSGDGFFGAMRCVGCLGCDNGVDFDATAEDVNCVSSDASADGPGGSASSFTNAQFEDYAADDFRLGSTTTDAKLNGQAVGTNRDAFGQTRGGTEGEFYAGWHTPDPAGAVPGSPEMSLEFFEE